MRLQTLAINNHQPHFISTYISLSPSPPKWAILDNRLKPTTSPKSPQKPIYLTLSSPPAISTLSIGPHLLDIAHPENLLTPLILGLGNGLILCVVKERVEIFEWGRMNFDYNEIVASLRRDSDNDFLLVCNAGTGQWVKVPKAPENVGHVGCLGFVSRVGKGGAEVGFVVAECRQPKVVFNCAKIMCFSSEAGEWGMKDCSVSRYVHAYGGGSRWRSDGAFQFDGRLFWVDLSCGLVCWDEPFCDEVERVECGFIPLPKGHRMMTGNEAVGVEKVRSFHAGGGCIQYGELLDFELRVWRLAKNCPRNVGEWSLVHRVDFRDIWCDNPSDCANLFSSLPVLRFIHPFDADVAVFTAGDYVFSVDLRVRKIMSCVSHPKTAPADNVVLPLVIPRWPAAFSPHLG